MCGAAQGEALDDLDKTNLVTKVIKNINAFVKSLQ